MTEEQKAALARLERKGFRATAYWLTAGGRPRVNLFNETTGRVRDLYWTGYKWAKAK